MHKTSNCRRSSITKLLCMACEISKKYNYNLSKQKKLEIKYEKNAIMIHCGTFWKIKDQNTNCIKIQMLHRSSFKG